MKYTVKERLLVIGIILGFAAPFIWFVGIMFECEYPYFITIARASHAHTVIGESAEDVIARTLGVPRSALNWHRCSFCKNFDRELPAGTIRVQVSTARLESYIFAFDSRRGIIYPGDDRAKLAFPAMASAVN
jgi:hypothetical protein